MSKKVIQFTDLLEVIFENTNTCIACLDRELNFLRVNKAYADINGKEPGHFTGKGYFDLFPDKAIEAIFRRAVKTGEAYTGYAKPLEYEHIPERSVTYHDWRLEPVINNDGEVTSLIFHMVDVTARIQAEEALEISEKKYRKLFENAQIGIYRSKLDGSGLLIANQKLADIFECSVQELLEEPTLIRWARLEDREKMYEKIKEEGSLDGFEIDVKTKSGKIKTISASIALNEGEEFLEGSLIDITEWKLAKNAQKESEVLLEKAQELAGLGHWKLDTATNKVEGSDELYRIFGLTGEETNLDAFLEVVHADDREMEVAAIQRGVEFGESWDIEHRLICGDGAEKWVHAIGEANRDNAGNVALLVGTVQDITELKKVDTALRESERLLKEAQHVAHMGYLDWNPITNDITWSEETYRIYGFPPDFKPTLESTVALVHPDDVDRVGVAMGSAIQDKQDYDIEHRMIRPDGKVIHVHAKGELTINEHGEVARMLGTVIDITDRKEIELELSRYRHHLEDLVEERTGELKAAQGELLRKEKLATLGQLTATVSHELRNPLGAMRPSMLTIQKRSDKKDEVMQQAIARVDRNVIRCDRIIDELLDFTRSAEIDTRATRIDAWLNATLSEIDLPKGIELVHQAGLGELELEIDTGRLRRALINIINNACEAMASEDNPDRGKDGATLTITTHLKDGRAGIKVTDTGSGIADDVLPMIFEPLFSTKTFGVGLGMLTIRQIVRQHGGDVEIKVTGSKGTTVEMWLPCTMQ